MPIDLFLCSLARVHQELAVGVVLTGTDSDGTRGLEEIKKYGGITCVEHPEFAEWDGMPKSALARGVVDFALLPSEIPAKLMEILSAREASS